MSLFRRPKPRPIVIGQEFGQPMTREEVQVAMMGSQDHPLYRAFGQMIMALREQSVIASDAASVAGNPSLSAYQHGSGNACLTLASMMQSLSRGEMGDDVKEWFKAQEKSV